MATMQNGLEVTDFLVNDVLRQLKNRLFIAGGFRSDMSSQYTKDFAVGETIRVPYPWRPQGGEGLSFEPEPIDTRHATVTCDRVPHVHYAYNTVEEALRMPREDKLKDQISGPAAQRMAQSIELMASQFAAVNTPNIIGTLGTDPTTLGFAGQARARLIEMGGWMTTKRRTAAVSTSAMQAITQAATVTTPLYNPASQIGKAFVDGYLGENGGWEFTESMSLVRLTAGTRAAVTCTISGGNQSGATLTLGCTSGDTFVAGEKFSIGSNAAGPWPVNPGTLQQANGTAFQCAIGGLYGTTYTATGATITLPITDSIEGPGSGYQNITSLPSDGATVTFWPGTNSPNAKVGALSLLFTRDAYAIVGVPMAKPQQGGSVRVSKSQRDPETGLEVSYIEMFDPIERQWICRWDSLIGFGSFYNRNCAIVFAGA